MQYRWASCWVIANLLGVFGEGGRAFPVNTATGGPHNLPTNCSSSSSNFLPGRSINATEAGTMERYTINKQLQIIVTASHPITDVVSLQSLMQMAVDGIEAKSTSEGLSGHLPKYGIEFKNEALRYSLHPHGPNAFTWEEAVALTKWMQRFEIEEHTAAYLAYNVVRTTTGNRQVAWGEILMANPSDASNEAGETECNSQFNSTNGHATS